LGKKNTEKMYYISIQIKRKYSCCNGQINL